MVKYAYMYCIYSGSYLCFDGFKFVLSKFIDTMRTCQYKECINQEIPGQQGRGIDKKKWTTFCKYLNNYYKLNIIIQKN